MTEPVVPATEQGPEPEQPRRAVKGIGRAALLIAGLTVLARLLGLARTLVFAATVKTSCLGAAYVTANQVPTVVYDIVLGGALTSIMVPILARPAQRSGAVADPGASAEVNRISSALLTWTIAVLLPVSVIAALAAGPVISWLDPVNPASGCAHADGVHVAASMLAVFAPQILLYGLAVVLYGILQAHRRFTAPALAPVLSSLVVITAYVIFVPLDHGQHTSQLAGLPAAAELTLSVGTTLGVAALVVTALVPTWRLRLRVRPSFRFPAGVARRARGLAAVGIIALLTQDASVLVANRLANGHGGRAAVALYSYGLQAFTSAFAVLAIPVAISAFPALSARQGAEFDDTAASSTRATVLASWLGAALLAGAAIPAARALPALSQAQVHQFALALAAFAPGLVGYGLAACLFRVLLADGRNRIAAAAMSAGWLLVIAIELAVAPHVPHDSVVPVLGLANTAGMTASGIALLLTVRRIRGSAALIGTARASGAGLAAALAGAAAGTAISVLVPVSGHFLNACLAVVACTGVLAAFMIVAYGLDGGDLRAAVARVRRRPSR